MGTKFFREPFFTTSSLRASGAVLTVGGTLASGATFRSEASSADGVCAAFTSDTLTGSPVTIGSLLVLVLVRLVLPPGINFDLAIIGYSLQSPKFRNELSC